MGARGFKLQTCAQHPLGSDVNHPFVPIQKWAPESSNLQTCAQPPLGSDVNHPFVPIQKWAQEDSNLRTSRM